MMFNQPFYDTVRHDIRRDLALSFVLSLFIACCAQLSVPFIPVPMTLQSFAVIMIALMTSPRIALGAVSLYIIESMMGLPVLAGFSTYAKVTCTQGYIIGFLMMAGVISWGKTYARTTIQLWGICLLAQIALYVPGIVVLSAFMGYKQAFACGLYPFLLQIPCYVGLAIAAKRYFKTVT